MSQPVAEPDPDLPRPISPDGDTLDGPDGLDRPAPGPQTRPEPAPLNKPAGTRISSTWIAISVALLALILLIVFILQNTQQVTVSFLWMQGSLPLAVALLIAGVGTATLTVAVGAARILQLRRYSRRARKVANAKADRPA
ncbi:lipopolysaccharide assembly LapA domain-containing protein [Spongisporangium articulatum]|uniref:Lipopolysaccharide assembly LapA domain-containing protein n=1 Tax=Spongisporangium articulatum TaxID=3362603 RepID=A0ABW8ALT6_9ACTN